MQDSEPNTLSAELFRPTDYPSGGILYLPKLHHLFVELQVVVQIQPARRCSFQESIKRQERGKEGWVEGGGGGLSTVGPDQGPVSWRPTIVK